MLRALIFSCLASPATLRTFHDMANERSVEIHTAHREAAEKFDYFVTGLTTALVAYIGERLPPTRLGANAHTIEVAALSCLVASVFFGFRRIEYAMAFLQINHHDLRLSEQRGMLMSVISSGQPGFNPHTGEVWTPQRAQQVLAQLVEPQRQIDEQLERERRRTLRLYRWRNRFLFLGFALLVIARLLPAYL